MLLKGFVYAPSGTAAEAVEEPEPVEADAGAEPETPSEPSPEPEPEVPDAPPSLGDVWKQHGIAGLPDDPQEFQRTIAEMRRQSAETERYRQYAAIQEQMLRQQQLIQQQAPKPAPEKPKMPWEIPSFDRRMIDQLMTDEQGNLVPKPGAMPNVVNDYRAWQTAREAAQDKWLADPRAVLNDLGYVTPEQVAQITEQRIVRYQRQTELRQFENTNREWLYDASGQFTPAGNMWNQNYIWALNSGYPDPIQFAEMRVNNEVYKIRLQQDAEAEKAAAAEAAEPTEDEKKSLFLHSAARKPNRTGAQPKKGKPLTIPKGQDGWEWMKQQLAQLPPEDLRVS